MIMVRSIFSNLMFNFNNKNIQATRLTNVVENTSPITPKFKGEIKPHGVGPPIKIQSKNKFKNIAIIDILKGVFASLIP